MLVPVYLRLLVYFIAGAGLAFVQMSEGINEDMSAFQWKRFWMAVFLAGVVPVKAFIDSAFTRANDIKKEEVKQEKIEEKNEKLNTTPTVLP